MSNPNSPTGFRWCRRLDGGAASAQLNPYYIQGGYATKLGEGDPVSMSGGFIIRANASSSLRGVFMGVKYTTSAGVAVDSNTWPASTATLGNAPAVAMICDDVNGVYVARLGGTTNAPTQASTSQSFASGGTGNYTPDNRSAAYLDLTTGNASSTQQWIALGFVQQPVGSATSPGNDPSSAYALMEVRMGSADYKATIGQ